MPSHMTPLWTRLYFHCPANCGSSQMQLEWTRKRKEIHYRNKEMKTAQLFEHEQNIFSDGQLYYEIKKTLINRYSC